MKRIRGLIQFKQTLPSFTAGQRRIIRLNAYTDVSKENSHPIFFIKHFSRPFPSDQNRC